LKTFWKGFSIVATFKDIPDSREEVNMTAWPGAWKQVIPALMEDVEGVPTSRGGSHCRCGGNSRRTRIRSGACTCDGLAASLVIELSQMRTSFLRMSKESGFLRWTLLLVKML